MTARSTLLLITCSVHLAPCILAAQSTASDTARVAPVVVTATRTPLTQGALPVAVSVITGEELRLRGITTVAEALRDLTSAYVAQSGSQGAQTSLFLRGGESKHVKVLIDGVPANDPGGFYDFSSLTADNVERIEVVRGPASVIHGADAVTGVVQVFTRRGRGPAVVTLDARTGMATRPDAGGAGQVRGTDLSADIAGSGEAASYAAGIARHETNGLYALNNGHHNNVLSGRFQFTPRAGTELRLALRYTDFRFNYPTNGGGTVGDVNANRTEDRTIVGVEVERRLTPTARGVLALNSSVNDGVTDDAMDAPTGSSTLIQDKTRRRGAELRAQWTPLSSAAATVGVQMEQQDHRQALQSESSFGPFMSSFRAARRNTGLYGEAVLTPVTALTATLGVRLDDNEAFGQFVTHRVGASWRPVATTRVRATLGNAFREPTFLENFSSGFATGNPGLEAERTSSWDAGVDQELFDGRVSASATYFAQRFTNMIDYDPADSCGFSYCNVAEATSKGTEIELRARVSAVWASVGATILKTEVLEPGFDQTSGGLYRRGESLIRRPERKITGELAYRGSAPLSASLRVQAVGKRTDRDFRPFPSTPVTLEGYERFDAGAEYALPYMGASRTALTLRVENLTDVTYENVFNFLSPRRTIVVGVRSAF